MLVPFEANCTTVQFLPLKFTSSIILLLLSKKPPSSLSLSAKQCLSAKLKTYVLSLSGESLFVGASSHWLSTAAANAYFHSASISVGTVFQLSLTQPVLFESNCKSLLCSMFNEQTCTRFTRLLSLSPCPK